MDTTQRYPDSHAVAGMASAGNIDPYFPGRGQNGVDDDGACSRKCRLARSNRRLASDIHLAVVPELPQASTQESNGSFEPIEALDLDTSTWDDTKAGAALASASNKGMQNVEVNMGCSTPSGWVLDPTIDGYSWGWTNPGQYQAPGPVGLWNSMFEEEHKEESLIGYVCRTSWWKPYT